MPKRRGRIQAREGVSAPTKNLHVFTTAGESFSSKICKTGGWRREIEWGEERGDTGGQERDGGTVKKMGRKSNRGYLYPRGTGTTGGKAPVLLVRSIAADRRHEEMNCRWYR
jgi:hypothetical protein